MKKHQIFFIFILTTSAVLFFVGCSFLKGFHTSEVSDNDINPLVPNTESTADSKRKSAADMCSFLKTSYGKMQELAAAQNAPHDGVNAAKSVEEQYDDRLQELFSLDFSAMDETQIDPYLVEMTDLITVIREARDALTFH